MGLQGRGTLGLWDHGTYVRVPWDRGTVGPWDCGAGCTAAAVMGRGIGFQGRGIGFRARGIGFQGRGIGFQGLGTNGFKTRKPIHNTENQSMATKIDPFEKNTLHSGKPRSIWKKNDQLTKKRPINQKTDP